MNNAVISVPVIGIFGIFYDKISEVSYNKVAGHNQSGKTVLSAVVGTVSFPDDIKKRKNSGSYPNRILTEAPDALPPEPAKISARLPGS